MVEWAMPRGASLNHPSAQKLVVLSPSTSVLKLLDWIYTLHETPCHPSDVLCIFLTLAQVTAHGTYRAEHNVKEPELGGRHFLFQPFSCAKGWSILDSQWRSRHPGLPILSAELRP